MSFSFKRGVRFLVSGNPFPIQSPTARNRALLPRVGYLAIPAIACALTLQISLVGCGMVAGPQPPSLQLPKPVTDLTASRTGNQVSLQWNSPEENTDRLKLKGMVQFRICRQRQAAPCQTIATISAAPGKPAQFTDALPAALLAGPLQPLRYSIFGINKHGRTAGPSNVAVVLAGEAPPPVENLSLQVVERGVVLHWQPVANPPAGTSIEIVRTLVAPPATARNVESKNPSALPRTVEPVQQKLRVSLLSARDQKTDGSDPGIALDSSVLFGRHYSYTVSRVVQRQVDAHTLEVASVPSPSVNVVTLDTFPPRAPSRLVAVPVSAAINNGHAEVDLSWSANTEPDLAQYRVYRRDVTRNETMHPVAPAQDTAPIVAPTFRDPDVQPGHAYVYAVTAVDTSGNESARSQQIEVTVPAS